MAALVPKSHHHYRVRSVSLPTRSHPCTTKVEPVVNKLKTLETSSSSSNGYVISYSLLGLRELYEAIGELLSLQLTQQALSQHQENNGVNELVDESVTFIDVCSNTRDTVVQMKQAIRALQSSLRRNKIGDLSIDSDIGSFMSTRKSLHKEFSRSLANLKSVENRLIPLPLSNTGNHQLSGAIKALTEANLLTISTFSSLLSFLSVQIMKKPKQTKWLLVSKLMNKGALSSEAQKSHELSELEKVDVVLGELLMRGSGKDAGTESIVESSQKKLEASENMLDGLEKRLELLFRDLIRTRVSLLNILSQ